jgi:hypothetical protein
MTMIAPIPLTEKFDIILNKIGENFFLTCGDSSVHIILRPFIQNMIILGEK